MIAAIRRFARAVPARHDRALEGEVALPQPEHERIARQRRRRPFDVPAFARGDLLGEQALRHAEIEVAVAQALHQLGGARRRSSPRPAARAGTATAPSAVEAGEAGQHAGAAARNSAGGCVAGRLAASTNGPAGLRIGRARLQERSRLPARPTMPPASTSHCARVTCQLRGLKSRPMASLRRKIEPQADVLGDCAQQLDVDPRRGRIAGDERRIEQTARRPAARRRAAPRRAKCRAAADRRRRAARR